MKIAAAFLTLMACAAPQATPPVMGESECDASTVQQMVGKTYSEKTGAEAMRQTRSGALRVIRPGQPVTMDYRTDRLNIEIDESGKILAFRCG